MDGVHVVFGAGGGAGAAVVRALASDGARVRAVNRSGRLRAPPGVERVAADAGDVEAAIRVSEGATVIYHCVNVPYAEWAATLPGIADSLIRAAGERVATLVYCDNLYMYGPPRGAMTESTPHAATSGKGRLRSRIGERVLEAHRSGEVRSVIGRASDFFGPGADNTVAEQLVLSAIRAGKRAHWLGSLDVPHSMNYVDDVGRALVRLGAEPRAHGEVWHVPAAPPITGRQFIEAAHEVAGRPLRLGLYSRWMLGLVALFSRPMREILEVLYQFEQPFVLDAEKFSAAFDFRVTPLREALEATLSWEANQEGAPAA